MQALDSTSSNGSTVSNTSFLSAISASQKEAKPIATKNRHQTPDERAESDARSIYIGNVEYAATDELLENHLKGCGAITRISIMKDRFTGHPKGHAYVEFDEVTSASNALLMTDTMFLGRKIKVSMKRTNKPGISSTDRAPRGRDKPRVGARRGGFGGTVVTSRPYVHGGFNRGRGFFRGMARGRRGVY